MWWSILGAGVGCYALKLAGLTVPPRWLAHPRAQRFATLVPVALLAALIAGAVALVWYVRSHRAQTAMSRRREP